MPQPFFIVLNDRDDPRQTYGVRRRLRGQFHHRPQAGQTLLHHENRLEDWKEVQA